MHISTTGFRKSTYSQHNGGCVEAGLFKKSSHSLHDNCIEAGQFGSVVKVADTTQRDDPHRPVLAFSPAAWQAFVNTLK